MAVRKQDASVALQAGVCKKCGGHNLGSRLHGLSNNRKSLTIFCLDCGNSLTKTAYNRYQATKLCLEEWGYDYNYAPAKIQKQMRQDLDIDTELYPVFENKKEAPVFTPKKTIKKEKTEEKKETKNFEDLELINEEIKCNLTEEKLNILKQVETLISNFYKRNKNEECPCTKTELLKMFGFTNEEIIGLLITPKYKKKFLKSVDEIIKFLNKGVAVYTRDKEGLIYKYTSMNKIENTEKDLKILDTVGLTRYAYIIID